MAYEFYRGPQQQRGTVPGLLRRCEFGLEILITLAHQSLVIGVSLDKAVEQPRFFWELNLSKSHADSLLSRLAREWHVEFDRLCQLLAVSAVVHTNETSWSLGSVWAFLSEQSRLMIFGCRKDAATLEILLPKETFAGVLVSDDAAVYRGFTQAQKCWAHLQRKAIKLTLLQPGDTRYRTYCDGLLVVYRSTCAAADRRLGGAGRQRRIAELEEQLRGLCWDHRPSAHRPSAGTVERDFENLALEMVRLMSANELFTFVKVPGVLGRTTSPNGLCAPPPKIGGPTKPAAASKTPPHDPGQRLGIAPHATPPTRPAIGPERSRRLGHLGPELLRTRGKSPRPDSTGTLAAGPTGPAADRHDQLVVGRPAPHDQPHAPNQPPPTKTAKTQHTSRCAEKPPRFAQWTATITGPSSYTIAKSFFTS